MESNIIPKVYEKIFTTRVNVFSYQILNFVNSQYQLSKNGKFCFLHVIKRLESLRIITCIQYKIQSKFREIFDIMLSTYNSI